MASLYNITLNNILNSLTEYDKQALVEEIITGKENFYTSVVISFDNLSNERLLTQFWEFILNLVVWISHQMDIDLSLPSDAFIEAMHESDHILSEVFTEDFAAYISHPDLPDEVGIYDNIQAMLRDHPYLTDAKPTLDELQIGFTREQSNLLIELAQIYNGLPFLNIERVKMYHPQIVRYTRTFRTRVAEETISVVDMVDFYELPREMTFVNAYPICIF
jgi:hypothetical protein